MEEHTFVFIGGLHRSGTSLLHRCLSDHPRISGFSDTGVPKDEGQHLQSVYSPAKDHGGPARFGYDRAAYLDESSDLVSQANAEALFHSWSKYWDLSRPILVEKSPPNLIRARFLQALFPHSYIIILLRHPIAVSFATIKWNASRIDHLLEHWLVCHERFEKDRPHLENLFVLKYEDFVASPQSWVARICSFLGIERVSLTREVHSDVNEKYFRRWEERPINRCNYAPVRSAARAYCRAKFERRVNHFGYSLKDLRKH